MLCTSKGLLSCAEVPDRPVLWLEVSSHHGGLALLPCEGLWLRASST